MSPEEKATTGSPTYPKIPNMKPVLFFHILAEEPAVIYSNDQEILTSVMLKDGGSIKSIDPEFKFNARITGGADDIRAAPGKPGVGNLDCRVYLSILDDEGKPTGQGGFCHYTGISHFSGASGAVVGKERNYMEFEEGNVTCHPKFFLDSKTTGVDWLNERNFLGRGRFLRNEAGQLFVQYVIYTFEL